MIDFGGRPDLTEEPLFRTEPVRSAVKTGGPVTYQPSGGMPDPYQPAHQYGQSDNLTTPNNVVPGPARPGYAPPATSGQPYSPQPDPYAQPGPYGRRVAVPVARTNTLAVLALVFAFLFAPAAIVLGRKAKRQIVQTGERGGGLATAGLVLGAIFTGLVLFGAVLFMIGALLAGSTDIR